MQNAQAQIINVKKIAFGNKEHTTAQKMGGMERKEGWMDFFFLRGRTGTEEAMINQQSKVHLICNKKSIQQKMQFYCLKCLSE